MAVDDDTQVNVRVSKRAKYAHLAVHADGRVEVTVPRAFPHQALVQFVTENQAWIEKKLQVVESRRARFPELYSSKPTVVDLPAIDEYWTVVYQQGTRPRISEDTHEGLYKRLKVVYRDEQSIHDQLRKWLQLKARQTLPQKVAELSRITGLEFSGVSIRGQKTCWGSCSSKKRISLNRSLLFLTPDLVRYLVLHELCHTRYMNHSKHFWALLCQFEPAARELDRSIGASAEKIPIWAQSR